MKTSVALCTYNGEKFLAQQIDSILNQSVKVDEIVVCDDQSTDATMFILNSYKEKHPEIFKIHRNERNLRSVKNFEKAISLCENEIVFLCDQDDEWLTEKVGIYLSYFRNHEDVAVLASNGFGIDEHNNQLAVHSIWDIPTIFRKANVERDYFEMNLFSGNFITGATIGIRKNYFNSISTFPEVEGFHHDEWIALNAAADKKLHFFEEKYIRYRVHDSQQVGGIFLKKSEENRKKLLKKYYFKAYRKSSKNKLSFLKLMKRREKVIAQVYEATECLNFKRALEKILKRRIEITKELKSGNFLLFLFNRIIGKI